MRDLPKTVPSAVLSAIDGALENTVDRLQRKSDAHAAYRSEAFRGYADECRAHVMFDELPAKAQALLDWGKMIQDELPVAHLAHRFWVSGEKHSPCLSVAVAEVALTAREGFTGGTLKTELLLVLDPKEGIFRNKDFFNGFLVGSIPLLKTPASVLNGVHPEILTRLHAYVADEATVWRTIEANIGLMVDRFKDR